MVQSADVRSQASAPKAAVPRGDASLAVPARLDPLYCAAKRLVDVLGASAGIVICLPIWVIAAILVKLESPGPIFFTQDRVGEHGRRFRFLKLRTMYIDAEQRKAALGERNEMDGPVFKMRHDPRITRTGRFLRRFSLDETPQLLHVLLGQMSLVGPRPQRPHEVSAYDDAARRRLRVKPGLTGLWQVSGRSTLTPERSIRLDLYYVENWSLSLDLVILARTLRAVLGGRGAC